MSVYNLKFLKTLVIGGPNDGTYLQESFIRGQKMPTRSVVYLDQPTWSDPLQVSDLDMPIVEKITGRTPYFLYSIHVNSRPLWFYADFVSFEHLEAWAKEMIYYRLLKFYHDKGLL